MAWLYFDGFTILGYAVIGIAFWLVARTEQMIKYIKNPYLFGLAFALLSWFEVGLYCFLSAVFYVLFQWVISVWMKKKTTTA